MADVAQRTHAATRQHQQLRLMADIRIGVRVSLSGRALRVVGVSPKGVDPPRVFLEDEGTGERFVVTTRVVGSRLVAPR